MPELERSVEGITTAAFFGAAGITAFVGLSPIVGPFSVGMALYFSWCTV
jgi:Na+:H+ antiporter